MIDWDFLLEITEKLSLIGKKNKKLPPVNEVEPFKHYFNKNGKIKYNEIDEYDGKFTRREILTRYLLVNVVLDQGPDMIGVRELLKNVTANLYRQEIRIFHRPIDFFKELGISINEILDNHESVKKIRKDVWAKENNTSPNKYNLFFAQSTRGIVSTEILDYALHRWGVPLCVPLLLEKDAEKENNLSSQPLIDYLESFKSAEIMSIELKKNERYGLGSAIGDKGCHLFVKMYVSEYNLVKNRKTDKGWTGISYEIPFDSNAGRVLWRSGFLLNLASVNEYIDWNVIQKGKGKSGLDYIRVTNIRNKKLQSVALNDNYFDKYKYVCKEFFREGIPRTVKIQRIPNLLLYMLMGKGKDYSIADFDDGLIHIGTNYCYNHEDPRCDECPIKDVCKGYNIYNNLISQYRT